MVFSYLLTAVLSGLIGAVIWLMTGGTLGGAIGGYVLTGNLVFAALLARHVLGDAASRPRR